MRKRAILLTGATGILGNWVLKSALDRGFEAVVLLRDKSRDRAAGRMRAVLELIGRQDDFDRVHIYYGDICLPGFGLTDEARRETLSRVSSVIHCAASISFNPKEQDEIWRHNLGGVENVIAFVAGASVPLYHVSTAYVAGRRKESCLESELDVGQEFVNVYERSKCAAEKLIHRAFEDGSLTGSVFRPGILVGGSQDGRISQFQNIYNFFQLLDTTVKPRLNGHTRLRIAANPSSTMNIVPVDYAAEALWRIIDAEGPSGKVYHLTNPCPPTIETVFEWGTRMLGGGCALEAVPASPADATRLEVRVRNSVREYSPYAFHQPTFDRANTGSVVDTILPFGELDEDFFDSMIEYARNRRWEGLFEGAGVIPDLTTSTH